jgi:hypothetical protein
MIYINSFKIFESQTGLTQEQEDFLNKFTKGSWKVNPSTGLVDVRGNFEAENIGLNDLKGIKFGEVYGYFSISKNYIKSLEGCPQKCLGFFCSGSKITSLKGSPKSVPDTFSCWDNQLKDFEGAPEEVGSFLGTFNPLTSLKGIPKKITEKSGYMRFGDVNISSEDWNTGGILSFYMKNKNNKEISEKDKNLLLPLITKEKIQKYIDENESEALFYLKPYLWEKEIKDMNLRWSPKVQVWTDIMTDAGELGF